MTEIWEGANTKIVDLDVKVGPYFTLPVFRAAVLLTKLMFKVVAPEARNFLLHF